MDGPHSAGAYGDPNNNHQGDASPFEPGHPSGSQHAAEGQGKSNAGVSAQSL